MKRSHSAAISLAIKPNEVRITSCLHLEKKTTNKHKKINDAKSKDNKATGKSEINEKVWTSAK